MKRFTLILSLLVAMVTTAMAQQSITVSTEADPVYYVIASYNRGGYLTNAGVGAGVTHVDLTDGSYWYFESAGDDGAVYFVNKLKDGENKIYLGSELTASTTPAKWYVIENGVNTKGLSISKTTTVTSYSCVDASNNNTGVGTWSPSSSDWAGTTWAFVKCSDYFNATYNPNSLILRTRSDRYVNTVSLGKETATVDQDYAGYGRAYFDLTSSVTFEVYAGQEVTPAITRDGAWTNAYAYIDLAGDGFTASVGENGAPGEDLVSYSFYSGDEANDAEGINSIGESLSTSARNTIAMPSFTAPSEPGTYRMRFKHDWNSINPNGSNANFMSNGGSIIDVTLIVKEVVATATINYSYQFNGVEKFTQTSTGYVGEEYPALTETAKFPYGITATKPAGLIEENDITDGVITKTIVLENTLPFAYADSYANINNWYYLQFHATLKNYLYYGGTADVLDASKTAVDASQKDNYTWGFIGDPFTGFTVVNYGAGEGKALNAGASGAIVGDEAQVMTLTASSHGENGFFMQNLSGDYTERFNKQNNQVVYWSGADAGSTFMVVERPMGATAELEALIAEIEAKGITSGTNPGEYTEASVNVLNEAIATAKAVETATAENVAALQAAYDALNVNPITAGLYRIVNAKPAFNNEKVLTAYGVCGWYGTASTPAWTQIDENDPLQYFNIEVDGDNYYVKAADDNYITSAGTLGSEPVAATFTWVAAGQYNITIAGNVLHANLHAYTHTSNIVGYGGGADSPSAWKLVAVNEAPSFTHTLTVSEAGWATLVLGFNAAIPAEVTAYTIASEETGYVTLAEATGVLKANVPVLVEATAGSYEFAYTAEAATVTESGLKGTLYNKNIAEEAYVLGIPEGETEVCFAKALLTDGAFLNNANKAYFVPTNAQANIASYSFRFGEGTTGIENVTTENVNVTVIYDLTGRRVEAITAPGIYVVNGKKVLVK